MGKSSVLVGALVFTFAAVAAAPPAAARLRSGQVTIPTHLTVGDNVFEGNFAGLRAYLDMTKITDPALFAQLSPELERLESRVAMGYGIFAVGATVGLAATVYAFVGRTDCPTAQLTDPNFSAAVDRSFACHEQNMRMTLTASLIGLGAVAAGAVGGLAIAPGRSEMMSFVNRHNGLGGREPIRFQLGYDPSRRFAHSGIAFSF
jgi:hypothetical protein